MGCANCAPAGIRVSRTPQRGALLAKAIELVQLSRESGYDRAELLDIIRQVPENAVARSKASQNVQKNP